MTKSTTEDTPECCPIHNLRKVFVDYVGMTPEEWLKKRRAGEIEQPNSVDNTAIHYRALLLEEVED